MIASIIDDVKARRAKFAREVEYLKETALDDEIDERTEVSESTFMTKETVDELKEAASYVDRMSGEEDLVQEAAEINYILTNGSDCTFDEMIGLK